jgi:hypothetical protein
MPIDIPDDLRRRLEQLAKGPGQEVGALVCETIEYRLAREERKPCWKPLGSRCWPTWVDIWRASRLWLEGNDSRSGRKLSILVRWKGPWKMPTKRASTHAIPEQDHAPLVLTIAVRSRIGVTEFVDLK